MQLTVNGEVVELDDDYADGMLVWALRDGLGMTGTKFGCGAGICGSCTVHVDGQAIRACITPINTVLEAEILTIEGLAAPGEPLHPVQEAFIEKQVPQCAWCMSGQMMTAAALIRENPTPSKSEIIEGMKTNYCRCGCYIRIREAVAYAAEIQYGEIE